MEESPKQHSSMPCMAEAMSKIKQAAYNNTIFRLRKQLTAAGLPESSYNQYNGGMCTWDPDIETSVDVCDFKQTIESARHEKSQKTKMEIYAKAWKLYTGEFLPDMMGEDWAAVENIACRDMYFDCVEELCHYLKTEEKFEDSTVSHTAQPKSTHSMTGRYGKSTASSECPATKTARCLQKNNQADVRRTRPVTIRRNARAIQLMGERTSQAAGAIEDIKYRLREKESIEGAYY